MSVTLTPSGSPSLSGGACTYAAADDVTAPITLDETQGWAAMRITAGDASTVNAIHFLFGFLDSNNARINILRNRTNLTLRRRSTGTASADYNHAIGSYSAGAEFTVVFRWTATEIAVSHNGGAFDSVANTAIPVLAATLFHIGSSNNAIYANQSMLGSMYWFAAGSGTLTDTDAATFDAFGDTDPTWGAIPGTPVLLWTCDDFTAQNSGSITISASAGSVAITGDAATLPVARRLTGSPAAVAVTGTTASLPVHRVVSASPANYAITGDLALLPVQRVLAGLPAAYAATASVASTAYAIHSGLPQNYSQFPKFLLQRKTP